MLNRDQGPYSKILNATDKNLVGRANWHPVFVHPWYKIYVKVKLKQSHYRPGQAQRVLRKLRFPDFVTTAQDGGGLSALSIGRLYPQEILPVLVSVRGWVDLRAIVRSEGSHYVRTHKPAVHQPTFGYHPTPAEPHQYTSTHRNRTIHLHTVADSWGWM